MSLDLTYTFEHQSQLFKSYPLDAALLADRKELTDFVLSKLSSFQRSGLAKISLCVMVEGDEGVAMPDWFLGCNGKLWFEGGKPADY